MHSTAPDQPVAQRRGAAVTTCVVAAMITAALAATAVSLGVRARDQAPARLVLLATAGGCAQCGVVQTIEPLGQSQPGTRHADMYRVSVRMGDGSVRTVEQRNMVLKGARVVLEGGLVRPAPDPTLRG